MPAPPIVLASASPRRRELLARIIPSFEVRPADIDERIDGDPRAAVVRIALRKAAAVAEAAPDAIVIGADTIVVRGGVVLPKPRDAADARRMLGILSDGWHEVLTGVAVRWDRAGKAFAAVVSTRVCFRPMDPAEIESYVRTGEPFDKAGAYAIQGFGGCFITAIEGDPWNVVGLPVARLYTMLKEMGVDPAAAWPGSAGPR